MELFKLFGTIAVNANPAKKGIGETTAEAETAKNKMGAAFGKIGKSFAAAFSHVAKIKGTKQSLKELTETATSQEKKLEELKKSYQNLHLTQGKNAKTTKECGKQIKELSSELAKNREKLEKAGDAANKYDKSLKEMTAEAETSSSRLGTAAKKIGMAAAAAFTVDKVKDFAVSCVETAAEVSAANSSFDQIMGKYSEQASKKMQKVADDTGVIATRLQPYMTSLTAKFKGLGYGANKATTLATEGLTLASDAAAFWDKSLDDAMGGLNSFINGNYEGGEAIGLFANDTQMAMYALKKGLIGDTKEWAELDEATKQATRLEYAEAVYKQSGATGQAAREAEQFANVTANLKEKWKQFQAQVGMPILETVATPAMQFLSGVIDGLSEAFEVLTGKTKLSESSFANLVPYVDMAKSAFQTLKDIFLPVINEIRQKIEENLPEWQAKFGELAEAFQSLSPILTMFGALVSGVVGVVVGVLNGLVGSISGIITAITGVLNVIGGIVNLIAGIFTLDGDRIKESVSQIGEGIVQVFSGLFDAVAGFLGGFVDGVVGFFQNLYDVLVGHSIVPDMITAIVKCFKGIWSKVVGAIKTFVANVVKKFTELKNKAKTIFNAVKDAIIKPITAAKNKFTSLFDTMKNKVTNVIDKMKSTVKNGMDKLKSIFSGTKLKLPNIKLPHIKYDLIDVPVLGEIPNPKTLEVEWYKQGGIMTKPTAFGYNPATGSVMAGGEAGAEAIAPIDTLLDYVRTAVKDENAGLEDVLARILDILTEYLPGMSNMRLVTDTGALVGALAPGIDSRLGDITRRRARAN